MGDDEEIVARLLVDADHAEQARRTLGPGSSETSRPDGAVEFGVAVTNVVAFRSFVLGFLEHAEILGPPSLRADTVAYLESLAGDRPR